MRSTILAADFVGEEVDDRARGYDVVVDHATLRVVDMGPKGSGYSVRLVGRIDDAWIRCFRSVQSDSRPLGHFGLDPRSWQVSFLRQSDDGPADVITALDALDVFVHRVNRYAGSF
jgi:hypothetical protein